MLGLAFAVASVSLNHLLRSGIWATCTLENQETEGKGGGRERQGLKMRWREQCHSCHIFFESGCIGLASLPICIPFAKFGRGGDGSTFGQKGEGRKTAEETGSFRAATVINAPGPACSTSLDITRHHSTLLEKVRTDFRTKQTCCQMLQVWCRWGGFKYVLNFEPSIFVLDLSAVQVARLWLDRNDWLWELQC